MTNEEILALSRTQEWNVIAERSVARETVKSSLLSRAEYAKNESVLRAKGVDVRASMLKYVSEYRTAIRASLSLSEGLDAEEGFSVASDRARELSYGGRSLSVPGVLESRLTSTEVAAMEYVHHNVAAHAHGLAEAKAKAAKAVGITIEPVVISFHGNEKKNHKANVEKTVAAEYDKFRGSNDPTLAAAAEVLAAHHKEKSKSCLAKKTAY